MASRSRSDKYFLANNPNGQVTDAQVVALKGLSTADISELENIVDKLATLPGSNVADVAALTSSDAAGGSGITVTDVEYDALRADVTAIRTKVNAILTALETVGILSAS